MMSPQRRELDCEHFLISVPSCSVIDDQRSSTEENVSA